ncbi:HugZ family protein [Ruixingdingia sedimenti]|uniref:Pyridoxamine 5'-phosphate oxidase family protein n=1 Tax=Ruixingdingia sedimenti TaxID=3073604 RepID=A0ABU1FED9_9RHOB|nr:pyridoxamine 5'-phosphate oxidase family protein [Xinfangfangia sp. LG-4]MDR5655257.1 pyridoxamine 5'-phosphate oxidase family protein [Xinfangfangia sp. LG-4]
MTQPPDPVAPADDTARALARSLLAEARHAALAVIEPGTGAPFVSRIALAPAPGGVPVSLISGLAVHCRALRENPACALLLGEPGDRGDPLTHPRLSLRARAEFVAPDAPGRADLRAHYLAARPKATLYADFADFSFVLFHPVSAVLNGGFARAYALHPADLLA